MFSKLKSSLRALFALTTEPVVPTSTQPVAHRKLNEPTVPPTFKIGLPQAGEPPSLAEVAARVPQIAPGIAAKFWCEALNYLDFKPLGQDGNKAEKPLVQYAAQDAGSMGSTGVGTEGQEVYVVLSLWEVRTGGQFIANGIRHPLLCVPAVLDAGKYLFPKSDGAPRLNERYLEPDLAKGAFSIGTRSSVEQRMMATFLALGSDPTVSIGWRSYWDLLLTVVKDSLGVSTLEELEAVLGQFANAQLKKGREDKQWKLCAVAYEGGDSGTRGVAEVYSSLINMMQAMPEQTRLFRQLCAPAVTQNVALLPDSAHNRFVGHIDEFDRGSRSLFPLDETQRQAVHTILALAPGEIQAVNGPPGSGKTSMLRAVVASLWVDAALKNLPCPIIVACGSTNQSVTNVIGAFGNAPHPDNTLPFAQRWIAGATSYGAFLPSTSMRDDPNNQEELQRLVVLKRAANGFLYEYWQRENILLPSMAVTLEPAYLQHASAALGGPPFEKLEIAVSEVWRRLDYVEGCRRQFYLTVKVSGDWQTLAEAYLSQGDFLHWSDKRRGVANGCIARLKSNPGDMQAAQEFMDLTWRADAFHLAARYWEGRFLLAQRERLLTRHPHNVEEALRRLCMLTPCLVSTLHTAPQFAQVDFEEDGPKEAGTSGAQTHTHSLGLFDLVVVDEAGQALPELGAAVFGIAKAAAVIGDLRQLAPISNTSALSEIAIARRVGAYDDLDGIVRAQRSVATGSVLGMARLVSRWTEPGDDGVTLRYHYRCKPSIVEYCNGLCYGHKLVTDRVLEKDDFVERSMGWVEVDAAPSNSGGSLCNPREADEVIDWIIERWPAWKKADHTKNLPIQDIVAIITPYRSQSSYFEEFLPQRIAVLRTAQPGLWPSESDVNKITIGTVHRLQGAERLIVCFSLVEGPEHASESFIDRSPSMLNVAVSRAKRSFIVFGNSQRLFGKVVPQLGSPVAPSHQLGNYLLSCKEAARLYPNQLVLIEAGGKRQTMKMILGKQSEVLVTSGALTRLEPGSGVNVVGGFIPRPTLESGAAAACRQAEAALKSVGRLVLATDDDRMGEYIAWQAKRLLQPALVGKEVLRVRMGAITATAVTKAINAPVGLDEGKILAEIVREVLDCLVTERFKKLSQRKDAVRFSDDVLAALAKTGALTSIEVGRVRAVGRVQGAVLRMLVDQAREVQEMDSVRRILATATMHGRQLVGHVVNAETGVSTTLTSTADQWVKILSGGQLQMHTAPCLERSAIRIPGASTTAILALAWSRNFLAPWVSMDSLQALYEGSWSERTPCAVDPIDPVVIREDGVGHPPVTPLDRADTPERMQAVMRADDWKVYSVVWDHFLASELHALQEEFLTVDFATEADNKVLLRFTAASCQGLPKNLEDVYFLGQARCPAQSVPALKCDLQSIASCPVTFSVAPASQWNVTPASLLLRMEAIQLGRPSTYVRALSRLKEKGLLAFPQGEGAIRLTPDGLATALALEQHEERLSSPDFAREMSQLLGDIEVGKKGPRQVLAGWMQWLVPEISMRDLEPRIWNSLSELEAAIDKDCPGVHSAAKISKGEAGFASLDDWNL